MTLLIRHIKAIMVLSGALTFTMVYAAVSPTAALESTFGESLQGPLAELIVRNWGILIAMVGIMLVHGAFSTETRRMALTVATASKIAFIGLVLANGAQYLGYGAGTAVAVDTIMVIIFASYLLSSVGTHRLRAAAL